MSNNTNPIAGDQIATSIWKANRDAWGYERNGQTQAGMIEDNELLEVLLCDTDIAAYIKLGKLLPVRNDRGTIMYVRDKYLDFDHKRVTVVDPEEAVAKAVATIEKAGYIVQLSKSTS